MYLASAATTHWPFGEKEISVVSRHVCFKQSVINQSIGRVWNPESMSGVSSKTDALYLRRQLTFKSQNKKMECLSGFLFQFKVILLSSVDLKRVALEKTPLSLLMGSKGQV